MQPLTATDAIIPATAVLNGKCRFCGREFEPELNGACPERDDCPSHFEAIGRAHPDHPPTQPLTATYHRDVTTRRATIAVTGDALTRPAEYGARYVADPALHADWIERRCAEAVDYTRRWLAALSADRARVAELRAELQAQHDLLTLRLTGRPYNRALLRSLLAAVKRDMALTDTQLLAVAGFIGVNGRGPAIEAECRVAGMCSAEPMREAA